MEDIIDIIVTETTNTIEITSQPTDEIIDVNIIDNREDVTLNVTPTLVEININSLTGNFGILWGEIEGTLSNQTDLNTALGLKADLVGGKVPSSQLPSYVDDVVEVANYAALPATGETGKIYVTIDTNYIYRWTGSVYVEIKDSSAVWGAITGTLSNQTDLQNALNAKDAVLTFSSPLSRSTNTVSIPAATTSVNGYLTSTDWTTFNAKQAALNGTGFVKISGTTISYDNSTYLTTSSASSTYVPYSGATTNVDLGNNSLTSNGIIINKTSNKAKISFPVLSGVGNDSAFIEHEENPVDTGVMRFSVSDNNLTNDYFVFGNTETGAFSERFKILATGVVTLGTWNGTAISDTYISSSSTWNAKQDALSGTGFVKISGSTISYDNSTYLTTSSASSTYLALAGGTLTGAVTGTRLTLVENSSNIALSIVQTGTGSGLSVLGTSYFSADIQLGSVTADSVLKTNGTGRIAKAVAGTDYVIPSALSSYLPLSGGTLTGALSGTSSEFSGLNNFRQTDAGVFVKLGGNLTKANIYQFTSGGLAGAVFNIGHNFYYNGTSYGQDNTAKSGWVISSNLNADAFAIARAAAGSTSAPTNVLSFASTGAATFSSSVAVNGGFLSMNGSGLTSPPAGLSYGLFPHSGVGLGISSSYAMSFWTSTGGGSPSQKMIITDAGNVGIGTTSPNMRLSIVGDGSYTSGDVAVSEHVDQIGSSAKRGVILGYYANGTSATAGMIRVPNNGNLIINPSGGNVGIGTTSPSRKLDVVISDSTAYTTSSSGNNLGIGNTSPATNSFCGITFYAEPTSGNAGISAINNIVTGSGDAALAFSTRGGSTLAERMRITNTGSVGIGTTSPNTKLDVRATSTTAYSASNLSEYVGLFVTNTGTGGFANITLNTTDAAGASNCTTAISAVSETSGTRNSAMTFATREHSTGNIVERMRITSGGQVQIKEAGGSHTSDGLSFINTGSNTWNLVNATDNYFYFGYNGTSKAMINPNNGSYGALSDKNKKEEIELSNIGLSEIMQLKPSLYRFKDNKDNNSIKELGFIAQEVKDCIPNAYVESGEFIGLNYNPIVAALTKAVQELKAELDTLKNK